MTDLSPAIRAMVADEARELLARNHVGRLAYSWRDRVNILPLHYVYSDDWIYGRTSPGEKLTTLLHNPWVAFEVDEVRGLFDWSSVVAVGTLTLLAADGSPHDREHLRRAMRLLGELVHGAFAARDPVPERSLVFGIGISELTGRIAEPGTLRPE